MGWLSSLVTKVVPKVWKAGVQTTSSLWRAGSSVVGAGSKVVSAVSHNPKTAAVVGVTTYAGWKKLGTNDSMGTAVGKTLREGVDGSGDFTHDMVNGFTGKNTVEEVKDTTKSVLDGLKDTASETKGILGTLGDTLQGISKFLGNMFGGDGMDMFSNFFSNLGNGKVSGLGIGALIASAYMIFGRTGLLGKIGGALMTMMMIGNNSSKQVQVKEETLEKQETQEKQNSIHR